MPASALATSAEWQSAAAHHPVGMRRDRSPRATSSGLRPRPALVYIFFSAFLLQAQCSPTVQPTDQHGQVYVVCKDQDSQTCVTWLLALENENELSNELTPWNRPTEICGLSDLKPIPPHRKFIAVKPFEGSQDTRIFCKNVKIVTEDAYHLADVTGPFTSLYRERRQTGYSLRGRYRGQTQSQYLAIDKGNGKDEGKAEAHSAADSSRASVSGNSGMGQAQSQTIYDPSCDECFGGRNDMEVSNLRRPAQDNYGYDHRAPGHGGIGAPGTHGQGIGGQRLPGQSQGIPGQGGDGGQGLPGQGGVSGHGIPSNGGFGGQGKPGQGGVAGQGMPGQGGIGGRMPQGGMGGNGMPGQGGIGGNVMPGQGGIGGNGMPGQGGIGGQGMPGQGGNRGQGMPGQGGIGSQGMPGQGGIGGQGMPGQGGIGSQHMPGQGGIAGQGMPGQGGIGSQGMPGQGGIGGQGIPAQGGMGGHRMPSQGGQVGIGGQGMPGQGSLGSHGMPGQGGINGQGVPGQGGMGGHVIPGQGGMGGQVIPDQGGIGGHGIPGQGGMGGQVIPGQGGMGGQGMPGQGGTGAGIPSQGGVGGQGKPGQGGVTGQGMPGQGGIGGGMPQGGMGGNGMPGQGGIGGQVIPGQGGIGGQVIPGQGGIGGQVIPGRGGIGGQVIPGQGGIGGQVIPGQGGVGGQIIPGQGGVGGQVIPGQGGIGGQIIPGHGGVGGQVIPGQRGVGGQVIPGQGGVGGSQDKTNWPISAGPIRGPDDLLYYCCVINPNQGLYPNQGMTTGVQNGYPWGSYQQTGGRQGSGAGGQNVPYGQGGNEGTTGGPGYGQTGNTQTPVGSGQQFPYGGSGAGGTGQQGPTYNYDTGTGTQTHSGPYDQPNTYGLRGNGQQGPNFNYGTDGGGQSGPGGSYGPSGNTQQGPNYTYPPGSTGQPSYPQQQGGGAQPTYSGSDQRVPGYNQGVAGQPNVGDTYPQPIGGGQHNGVTSSQPSYGSNGNSQQAQNYPYVSGGRGPGGTYVQGNVPLGTGGHSPQLRPYEQGGNGYVGGGNQQGPDATHTGGVSQGPYNQGNNGQPGLGGTYGPNGGGLQTPSNIGSQNTYQSGGNGPQGGGYGQQGSGNGQQGGGFGQQGGGNGQQGGGYEQGGSNGQQGGGYGQGGGNGQQVGGYGQPGGGNGQQGGGNGQQGSGYGQGGGNGQQGGGYGQHGGVNGQGGGYGQGGDNGLQGGGNGQQGGGYGQQGGGYGQQGGGYGQQGGNGQQGGGYGQQGGGYGQVQSGQEQGSVANGDHIGEPQNVLDPNSIIGDDDDSQALASVYQGANGTTASASSQGGNVKGHAQTNVQGTYTDSGSFSAQASISDDNKGAESQVSGSKKGASSNAEGRGRKNKSQAAVKLGSETGSIQTESQSGGNMHSSSTQVQGSVKGGVADAQARGPGSTSSQAQIGFTPYKEGDKEHELLKTPFEGGGTASAQSSGRMGTSQSQLRGTFKYGITYNGAAQAGASLDKDAVFSNFTPFEKIDVFDQNNTNINVNAENTERPLDIDLPPDTSVNEEPEKNAGKAIQDSNVNYEGHSHYDHHKSKEEINTTSVLPLPSNRRAFSTPYGNNNNGGDYDYNVDDTPPDEYDVEEVPDGAEGIPSEYTGYDNYGRDTENTHQSQRQLSSSRKGLEVRQTTGGNTQHILIGSLKNQDAKITQIKSEHPDESKVYQPGERVPGMGGYIIPAGFTGSVKSVSSKEKTYVVGTRHSPSQAQTVTLTPGTGKVKYVYPERYGKNNVNPKDLRSLYNPRQDDNRYVSVSKSVTRDLDSENNIRKQYSHTYYTKSSSCGYFTFTCTMVSSAEGKKKVCRPKIPTNPDGTPMRC